MIGGLILWGLFGLGGVGLVVAGFRDWRMSSASVNWPTVEAEIMKSEVVTATLQPTRYSVRKEMYKRRVTFRYSVAGAEYTADATLPLENTPSMAPEATEPRLVAPLPRSPQEPRARLMIWYDPADPQTAIADRDALAEGPITMGIGAVLTLVVSLFGVALWSRVAGPAVKRALADKR